MNLNERQKIIYDFLLERKASGVMPTVREICKFTGISSTSVVHKTLRQLQALGYIDMPGNASRSITIKNFPSSVSVPIMGKVTAGEPIFADQNITDYVALPASVGKGKNVFGLKVSGLSMKDAGILDGDIVIADRDISPSNGDIIVALIGDEATVKRLGYSGNSPVLYPENDDFKPIYPETLISLGKVVACYREF